jgi:bifunctional DNA-binding transcriptional regulator/antitoxin component of YhaV-PrlF toxin-antitoxin module
MKFRATLQLNGKTATGIEVPETVVTELGAGKKPPVRVTINQYTYRTSVGSMGGVFMLPVSAEVREHAGVAAGDELEVEIEHDTEPREVTVPPDFAAALDQDAAAKHAFEKLAYSHKQRHVLAIEQAKSPETRQRRIDGAIAALREGK